MIPRTFPSTFATNGQQQMVVYVLPSIAGLTAWIDYIPVKGVTTESATLENTYANGGYQVVDSLESLTGLQAWLDYIPVYEDASYNKPWSTDAGGYVPVGGLTAAFSPLSLFASGAQGVWYDPSDYGATGTLFQDSAGTTPVTAVEQPVGLMLDKSQGLVLGPERKADFVTDIVGTATAATYNTTTGEGSVTRVDLSNQSFVTLGSLSSGFYKTTISCQTGSIIVRAGAVTGTQQAALSAGQTLDVYVNTVNRISISHTTSAGSSTFTVVSVKELPGNHAFQSTSASRPVLSARYNLLTKTEQFDDAAWGKNAATVTANAIVAPDGTTTADLLIPNGTSAAHYAVNTIAVGSAGSNGFSIYIKASGYSKFGVRDQGGGTVEVSFSLSGAGSVIALSGATATAAITAINDGWYRVVVTSTIASATQYRLFVLPDAYTGGSLNTYSWTGDGTSGIYLWGAQLIVTNSLTSNTYQRVNTATDYDTTGFLPYLKFDGVDDSLSTNSISFTSTDKMSVFAGVRKLSDAAAGILVESSVNAGANNGAFNIFAPSTTAPNGDYALISRGTSNAVLLSGTFAAPITNVVTGLGNISGDLATLRLNGAQVAQSTADQGTGNYGNYPLYIGRRNNASLPFNGQLYSMVIVGKAVTAGELTNTETFVATKTGVTL